MKKYNINIDYFRYINNQEKAYWLGFILADGCIQDRGKKGLSFALYLKESDVEHIQNFKLAIESNNPIKFIKQNKSVGISIYNKNFCNNLIKQGCVPRKTYNIEFPALEESLIRHFIRGYFDGDGCVWKKRKFVCCGIRGMPEFLKSINQLLIDNKINGHIYKYDSLTVGSLDILSKESVLNFYKYIYQDSTIFLSRKYNKFEEVINV